MKIQELARKAGFGYSPQTGIVCLPGSDPELFARLILTETKQMINNIDPDFQGFCGVTANVIAREINTHFSL